MSLKSTRTLPTVALLIILAFISGCSISSSKTTSATTIPTIARITDINVTPQKTIVPTVTQTEALLEAVTSTKTPEFATATSTSATGSLTPGGTLTPEIVGTQAPTANTKPSLQSFTGNDVILYLTKRSSSVENAQSLVAFDPASKMYVVLNDNVSTTTLATSRLSGDKSHLALLTDNTKLLVLNINDHTQQEITLEHSCNGLSWSPQGDRLLLSCGDIYVYTLANQSWQPITTSIKANEWSTPSWSPDGKWIAYIHPADSMPPVKPTSTPTVSYKTKTPPPTPEPIVVKDPQDGLYLVNANCLLNITTCPSFTFHIQAWLYAPAPPAWSPDSLSVAVYNTGTITIYNSVGEFKQEIDLPELHTTSYWAYQPIVWSPNGEYLALSGGKGDQNSPLKMLSIQALTVFEMMTGDQSITLLDWLALPTLKLNHSYMVSMAGDTLKMHETPSQDGTLIHRLKRDDVFTVTDGPTYAEGYIWWKVKENTDLLVGWIVDNPDWFINSK